MISQGISQLAIKAIAPKLDAGRFISCCGIDDAYMRAEHPFTISVSPRFTRVNIRTCSIVEQIQPIIVSARVVAPPSIPNALNRINAEVSLPAYLSSAKVSLDNSVLQFHKASGGKFNSFEYLSEFLRAYGISEALAGLARGAIVDAVEGEHNKVMAENALSNIAKTVRFEDYNDTEPMIRRGQDDVEMLITYVSNVRVSEVDKNHIDGLVCDVLEQRTLSESSAKLLELLRYAELGELPKYSIKQIVSSAAPGNDAHVRDNAIAIMQDLMTYGVPPVLEPEVVVAFCRNIEDLGFSEIIDQKDAHYSNALFQTLVDALNTNPVLRTNERVVEYTQGLLGKVEPLMQDLAPSLRADIGGLSRMF